jgi:hypothetical protein
MRRRDLRTNRGGLALQACGVRDKGVRARLLAG